MSANRTNPETDCDEYEVDKNQRRIVLVGKKGAGKSSTANTILGGEYFESKTSAQSVTGVCSKKEAPRFGKNLLVVDTPGIFDTRIENEEFMCELVKCVTISTPGPHVFLIVITIGRFTEEEQNTIDEFIKYFSEKAFEYSVVVFTGKDHLDGIAIADYIEHLPRAMKTILQKCGDRYIAFNNKADTKTKDEDVKRLLGIVEQIMEENGGSCFTFELYRAAEEKLQEKMEKIKEAEINKKTKK